MKIIALMACLVKIFICWPKLFEEGEGMTKRQAKIILIEFIGYCCNFSQKELKGWDRVFARLKLKHC
jgi:hypothetical protein